MSTQSRKRQAGKKRMREKLSSLPVEDKLRIVEKLRDDAVKPSVISAERFAESIKHEQDESKPLLLDAIHQTLERRARGKDFEGSEKQERLASEVQHIFDDREQGAQVLRALFPEGAPINSAFFERLLDLEMRLGWNDTSHRATALLLLVALKQVSVDSAEALLREVPRLGNPHFFQALEPLKLLLADLELRPEFAAEWFPALVRRIGNDLASGAFWKALAIYCERHTHSALNVLTCLTTAQSEEEISVAAYILGVLRTLDVASQISAQLKTVENRFVSSGIVGNRLIYYRSWIQTAFRGKIRKEDLERLAARMCEGSSDEREQVFWIVCRVLLSPSIPENCFNFGLDWLRLNASGTIAATAKYQVIDFAAQLSSAHRHEACELVLLVQPILAEHKGIWQRLEHFLVGILEQDIAAFVEFVVRLGRLNPINWLKALKTAREFEWLLSEMRSRDVAAAVGQLVFDESSECRKLGLFFFDDLDLGTLPKDLLHGVDERRAGLAFYESQRVSLHATANARLLIVLIPCLEHADSELKGDFYDELVLQLKNYPGGCREEFERRSSDFSILQKAIAEVDAYFVQLNRVREAGIAAMEVSGFRQAAKLHRLRFARAVSKGAEEMSVFAKMFKKVRLLYGKQWSTFHGGALSQSSGLQEFSTSVEVPRMEFIDPEGMNLRRYHASVKIRELSKTN
jgi:hypothetical protein